MIPPHLNHPPGSSRGRSSLVWTVGLVLISWTAALFSGCQTRGDASSGHTTMSGVEATSKAEPAGATPIDAENRHQSMDDSDSASVKPQPGVVAETNKGGLGNGKIAPRSRRGGISDITFDDLELDMPESTLFERSMLTSRAAELDGRDVRIRGFIFAGGVFQQSGITSFPFVMNTQCKFGPRGLAYCVILVDLNDGVTTDFTTYPVTVEGRLTVRPFNSSGFTWSVYHLQGRRVY